VPGVSAQFDGHFSLGMGPSVPDLHVLGRAQKLSGLRRLPQTLVAALKQPIFVVGRAQHGKSVFRKALAEALGVKGGSCSDVIYVVWSLISGVGEHVLRAMPKEQARPQLVALGDWLTATRRTFAEGFPAHLFPGCDPRALDWGGLHTPSPAFLIRFSWENGVRVLDGIRREAELEAAQTCLDRLGAPPVVVWIDNPNAAQVKGDNFSISPGRADRVFTNAGTVEDLQDLARGFAKEILEKSELDA